MKTTYEVIELEKDWTKIARSFRDPYFHNETKNKNLKKRQERDRYVKAIKRKPESEKKKRKCEIKKIVKVLRSDQVSEYAFERHVGENSCRRLYIVSAEKQNVA